MITIFLTEQRSKNWVSIVQLEDYCGNLIKVLSFKPLKTRRVARALTMLNKENFWK